MLGRGTQSWQKPPLVDPTPPTPVSPASPAPLAVLQDTARHNLARFIAFRVFFNARWYYPVITVVFLDFGLTLEQYALLNVFWAASIVCLELPLGAVADRIGRRRVLVLAALCMVLEQAILAFAPLGVSWLFWLFLANRILSGTAEALASGADEALAYDSLRDAGREAQWPHILARLMRWQSACYLLVVLAGGALYDARFLQQLADAIGLPWTFHAQTTMRFPLYLTLANALAALVVTLQMRETQGHLANAGPAASPSVSGPAPTPTPTPALKQRSTLHAIREAGRWLWLTPAALAVLLAGVCCDSSVRLFLTIGSNYQRLIGLPERAFGLIGASTAIISFFTPRLAQHLVRTRSQNTNFLLVAGLVLLGLCGVAMAWPLWGVLCFLPLGLSLALLNFFASHYLNLHVTDSSRRATLLSFRGLLYNLGYGAAGLALASYSRSTAAAHPGEDSFPRVLAALPAYFLLSAALLLAFALLHHARSSRHTPPTATPLP